jgi:hypothetical protein
MQAGGKVAVCCADTTRCTAPDQALLMLAPRPVPEPLAGRRQTWLPDSPRWLLLSGAGRQAAAAALARARGRYGSDAASVGAEIAAMERAAERSGDSPGAPMSKEQGGEGWHSRGLNTAVGSWASTPARAQQECPGGEGHADVGASAAPMRRTAAVAWEVSHMVQSAACVTIWGHRLF